MRNLFFIALLIVTEVGFISPSHAQAQQNKQQPEIRKELQERKHRHKMRDQDQRERGRKSIQRKHNDSLVYPHKYKKDSISCKEKRDRKKIKKETQKYHHQKMNESMRR